MMKTKFRKKNVLIKNKGIDQELVKKHEALEKELKKLGVDTTPKFRLSPPLNSKHMLLYNE
ncbi:MAG: hypothetical protein HY739_13240 [Desulfobacterales bacterium]|nr:hypothetical protein [Desulfobacterales bacterium]